MPDYVEINSEGDMIAFLGNREKKEHYYAVLVFNSITIPGDERSRTNPGHGYPASQESANKYLAFNSKEVLETWIAQNKSSKRFIVLSATQLKVEIKTVVSLG